MKIGIVLDDTLDVGDGVQQAVLTIGEYMRARGHDVHYLAGMTERTDIVNVHSLAKTMKVSFNGNKMRMPLPVSSKKIREFLESERFDVLHIQMPYSPLFAEKVILNAPKGTKIIGTFHILPYSKLNAASTKLLGLMLRRSLNKFNHVVSVSSPASDFCFKTFKVESVVIPNPVDMAKFKVPKNISSERRKIVFLGRLVERKGAMELVKAYGKLLDKHPELNDKSELIIAGKGELEDALKCKANNLPVGAKVTFPGFIADADKAPLLSSADLAVFPSKGGESFGIVLIEAMASGSRLVLAGDNPGYRSVMQSYPELLVNPKDTDALADRIYDLLQENEPNNNLSKKLQEEVKQYDVSFVADKLLSLYNS